MFSQLLAKLAPKEVRLIVLSRDPCRLRLDEWRSSKEHVAIARKVLSDPSLRLMLDICRTEHPASQLLLNAELSERAVQQARIEGYHMCLNNIEALGSFQAPTQALESEFLPEQTT